MEATTKHCTCDYDVTGDPPAYAKASRHCCPVHDACESCGIENGIGRFRQTWLCGKCERIDFRARILAGEYHSGAVLETLDKRRQQELWEQAADQLEREAEYAARVR